MSETQIKDLTAKIISAAATFNALTKEAYEVHGLDCSYVIEANENLWIRHIKCTKEIIYYEG